VAAPEKPHRDRDLAEQVLVFRCVDLMQLAVLAVVRRLAFGTDPGSEQVVDDTGPKPRCVALCMWLATSARWA
jgi:hypothetical protein